MITASRYIITIFPLISISFVEGVTPTITILRGVINFYSPAYLPDFESHDKMKARRVGCCIPVY